MNKTFTKLIASGLGLGYSPAIPGTAGSLLGIIIFILLTIFKLPLISSLYVIIALFILGVLTGTEAEKIFNRKDPRQVVIDEIVGCLIYLFIIPLKLWCIILGFIIYRILDIIKPSPARESQILRGGWGIMMDDVIAGIYAGGLVRIISLFFN